MYKDIVSKYFGTDIGLLIKPHPRDQVDYRKVFSNAVIINNSIASEVLNFSGELKVNTALTLYSTSINTFKNKAKKVIRLEVNEMDARNNDIIKLNK